ncbi:MAG: helix-turn-helix transcriptional regulator [Lachnospiraceae bacterium]|nr:helix-turn-helix transcriptional regulator [Lachnospiraceae bacterium]
MFGTRLNQLRKKRGYTALQMATILSVGLRTYRHYESGHSSPSFDTLIKIADTLDTSIDWLLGRDDYLKSHGVSVDEYL